MRTIMLSAGFFMLCIGLSDAALAAEHCPAQAQQINDSNSLLMLGGTARGPIKQVVVGEFGKDVDQQKRILGQFDRCGALIRADISFDKNEGNMMLHMEESIARVSDGWQSIYVLTVFVEKDGKLTEVNHKQGTVNYMISQKGVISHSTDAFQLNGEKGFTDTTNSFDSRLRLIKSLARGTDQQANGEYHFQWNNKNQLISSNSVSNKMTWSYDKQDRELRLLMRSHYADSELSSVDECQLWDPQGNCTLSYSHETEVFANGEINRHISAASRYEYWDDKGKP